MKRTFDFTVAFFTLLLLCPIIIIALVAVWIQDFKNPFFIASRVGRHGVLFPMFKIRTMIIGAEKSQVDSTSADDMRITAIGRRLRQFKLDEVPQLLNVVMGQMSLVGPRPNVPREVALYTEIEKELLTVRPGITDIASIVFADEAEILSGRENPDLAYNQLIRPWKSRLALLYIHSNSFYLDIQLLLLTIINVVNRSYALNKLAAIAIKLGADKDLETVCLRSCELHPTPPPGSCQIVEHR